MATIRKTIEGSNGPWNYNDGIFEIFIGLAWLFFSFGYYLYYKNLLSYIPSSLSVIFLILATATGKVSQENTLPKNKYIESQQKGTLKNFMRGFLIVFVAILFATFILSPAEQIQEFLSPIPSYYCNIRNACTLISQGLDLRPFVSIKTIETLQIVAGGFIGFVYCTWVYFQTYLKRFLFYVYVSLSTMFLALDISSQLPGKTVQGLVLGIIFCVGGYIAHRSFIRAIHPVHG